MGACDFTQVAFGKTASEAFDRAHNQATYMHGHGGYSGTLAEKHGFVEFALPPRVSAEKFLGWLYDADSAGEVEYARDDLRRAEQYAAQRIPGKILDAKRWVARAKKHLREAERDQARFAKKVGPHAQLVQRAHQVWDDKWGPAVAIQLTSAADRKRYLYNGDKPRRGEKAYLFCGLASS